MKKFGLVLLGIIAGIVALANVGPLLALALSGFIAYVGFHYYRKSGATVSKLFWGGVILVGLLTAISNVPAFIGILAIVGVLYVWHKWKGTGTSDVFDSYPDDPFINFEREWNNITK